MLCAHISPEATAAIDMPRSRPGRGAKERTEGGAREETVHKLVQIGYGRTGQMALTRAGGAMAPDLGTQNWRRKRRRATESETEARTEDQNWQWSWTRVQRKMSWPKQFAISTLVSCWASSALRVRNEALLQSAPAEQNNICTSWARDARAPPPNSFAMQFVRMSHKSSPPLALRPAERVHGQWWQRMQAEPSLHTRPPREYLQGGAQLCGWPTDPMLSACASAGALPTPPAGTRGPRRCSRRGFRRQAVSLGA
jgi:hypothetical protein